MIANVRARFSNGVLTPLEPLDLEEGAVVSVSVEAVVAGGEDQDSNAPMRAVGAWKGTHDPKVLLRNIYADRLLNSRPGPQM